MPGPYSLSLTLVASVLVSQVAAAIGPTADLPVVNLPIAPDGFNRSAVLAGGTFPGPLITANKGEDFNLNVINQLQDVSMLKSTSIHWHGFFQAGTNWADGPSFINQCPIATGDSFLYSFHTGTQAGTFWYHSHLSTQYCDGLRGAMVVYDPNDPHADLYDIDNESTVITLADWYHTVAPAAGAVPTADATLINGLGRYNGGPTTALAVITVTQGKRYRFRLVAISCDPNYVFAIDGHNMTIIEADSISTTPYTVDSLQIYAGQRYSFVLSAAQAVDNYWIRADPNNANTGFINGMNSAILRYVGAPIADPTTIQSVSLTPMLETSLSPLENPGAPGSPTIDGVDIDLALNLNFDFTTFKFTVNGVTFVPPTVPVLLQILSGATDATSLLPSGSVYTLPLNKTIQLSFNIGGAVGGPHPFHLHGHAFDVIRSAGSDVYNYENPVRRDVVATGTAADNVTIRFRTDNSGPWFLHCHIDWHLELGLAIVFAEDAPGTASKIVPPDAWNDLCPKYATLNSTDLGGIV
ncbi:laccase [Mycena floridula]|nr:laccase [Mycena floridula]